MSDSSIIYQQVHRHYGSLARATQPENSSAIAKAFGYSEEELNSIPAEANLGVSCGNPLAIASLREGETVIDLGSGAGFDVFLASKQVGLSGHVIGVDMNKNMLERARRNQSQSPDAHNVSFLEANITSIPLESGLADCIISNCVINLVPEVEKPVVFAEMARLLKLGGRVAVSDILARKPLPPGMRDSVALYVGCIAGASTKNDYARWLKDAGFEDIVIVDTHSDLNVYLDTERADQAEKRDEFGCCKLATTDGAVGETQPVTTMIDATTTSCAESVDSFFGKNVTAGSTYDAAKQNTATNKHGLSGLDLNEWTGSFKIFAVKN